MAERTTTTRNAGGGGGEEDALAYLQRHCVQERLSAALLAAASETISFGTPPMTAVANALNSNKPQDLFTYRTLATNAKSRVRFLQLFNAMCRDLHPTNPALTGTEYLQLLRLICPDFPSSVIEDVLNILLVECSWECFLDASDFPNVFKLVFHYDEYTSWLQTTMEAWRTLRDHSGTDLSFMAYALLRYMPASTSTPVVSRSAFRRALEQSSGDVDSFSDAALLICRHGSV